jgi:hypothetical protein
VLRWFYWPCWTARMRPAVSDGGKAGRQRQRSESGAENDSEEEATLCELYRCKNQGRQQNGGENQG